MDDTLARVDKAVDEGNMALREDQRTTFQATHVSLLLLSFFQSPKTAGQVGNAMVRNSSSYILAADPNHAYTSLAQAALHAMLKTASLVGGGKAAGQEKYLVSHQKP